MEPKGSTGSFDFDGYLDFLVRHHHDFIRLWRWESTGWDSSSSGWKNENTRFIVAPHPWKRTGPGIALDGKPKFDLTMFDPDYFTRLRSRVQAARQRGIYVSVMLFEGWGLQFAPDAWENHPFNPQNNINGINGDTNGDKKGIEVHELADPKVTAVQEAYVRKVIETVGDLDNVLYEISNENHPPSTAWQYHMIRFIKEVERARPQQHPVGMTFQYKGGTNQALFDSPADWVSPNPDGGYKDDPPINDGRKVVLNDTDHLWGIGGNSAWVWKSFLRGHNPLFMDPYDGKVLDKPFDPKFEPVRRSLGQTLRYAERLDMAAMVPSTDLASSGYCLAATGRAYLIYLPEGGKVTVDLSHARRGFSVEWFQPGTGRPVAGETLEGGGKRTLKSPVAGGDAVVLLEGDPLNLLASLAGFTWEPICPRNNPPTTCRSASSTSSPRILTPIPCLTAWTTTRRNSGGMVAAIMGAQARLGIRKEHHEEFQAQKEAAEKKKKTTITAESFDKQVAHKMGKFFEEVSLPMIKKLVEARKSYDDVKRLVKIPSTWGAKISGEAVPGASGQLLLEGIQLRHHAASRLASLA